MITRTALLLIFASLLAGCKSYYLPKDFDEQTETHKTIAILPFEIETKGLFTKKLTAAEIDSLNEEESRAFQISFHNQILESARRGKKSFRVSVQHYQETLSKLQENNISVLESWTKPTATIAKILGVDAVVRGRIEKEKYFSDELSAGIEIGSNILSNITPNPIPAVSNNNKNIKTDYALLGAEDSNVLWSINYNCNTDWQKRPEQIVNYVNGRASRHFPYRAK